MSDLNVISFLSSEISGFNSDSNVSLRTILLKQGIYEKVLYYFRKVLQIHITSITIKCIMFECIPV